jgi:hypothetical protein
VVQPRVFHGGQGRSGGSLRPLDGPPVPANNLRSVIVPPDAAVQDAPTRAIRLDAEASLQAAPYAVSAG